jgi:hypothetical protein
MTDYALTITLTKTFDNEANMRSSRDAVKAKALAANYIFRAQVDERD